MDPELLKLLQSLGGQVGPAGGAPMPPQMADPQSKMMMLPGANPAAMSANPAADAAFMKQNQIAPPPAMPTPLPSRKPVMGDHPPAMEGVNQPGGGMKMQPMQGMRSPISQGKFAGMVGRNGVGSVGGLPVSPDMVNATANLAEAPVDRSMFGRGGGVPGLSGLGGLGQGGLTPDEMAATPGAGTYPPLAPTAMPTMMAQADGSMTPAPTHQGLFGAASGRGLMGPQSQFQPMQTPGIDTTSRNQSRVPPQPTPAEPNAPPSSPTAGGPSFLGKFAGNNATRGDVSAFAQSDSGNIFQRLFNVDPNAPKRDLSALAPLLQSALGGKKDRPGVLPIARSNFQAINPSIPTNPQLASLGDQLRQRLLSMRGRA